MLEENIYFLTLITCPSGANTIAYAFPNVKIIASEVDEKVNKDFHLIPGIGKLAADWLRGQGGSRRIVDPCVDSFAGNFGNRYFGTD